MTSKNIDIDQQRRLLGEMLEAARSLADGGDDFLAGQYGYVCQQLETLLAITDTGRSGTKAVGNKRGSHTD